VAERMGKKGISLYGYYSIKTGLKIHCNIFFNHVESLISNRYILVH